MTVAPAASEPTRLGGSTLTLYALIVWSWGTSWYALHHQLGVVPPEVALVWRFALASAVMFLWCRLDGTPLSFGWADHMRMALLSVFQFSGNFLLFYYGGALVASGLLAVVFSTASIFNLLLGAVFLRQRIEFRVLIGALIGVSGIGLIYWPEIALLPPGKDGAFDVSALAGLGLCIAGTLTFCIGNMLSSASQKRGIPVKSMTAWGCLYGGVALAALALALGRPFIFDWSMPFVLSLAYLVVFSTVIAFAAYLTLLGRIGAARAGYATVLFPVLALLLSSWFEAYHWTLFAAFWCCAADHTKVYAMRFTWCQLLCGSFAAFETNAQNSLRIPALAFG
jgi:drug/metabolite transporter (DMT)-like permease